MDYPILLFVLRGGGAVARACKRGTPAEIGFSACYSFIKESDQVRGLASLMGNHSVTFWGLWFVAGRLEGLYWVVIMAVLFPKSDKKKEMKRNVE